MWLFDVIKNGTLVDNQIYTVRDGVLDNRRLDASIKLKKRANGQWINPQMMIKKFGSSLIAYLHGLNDALMTRGPDKSSSL